MKVMNRFTGEVYTAEVQSVDLNFNGRYVMRYVIGIENYGDFIFVEAIYKDDEFNYKYQVIEDDALLMVDDLKNPYLRNFDAFKVVLRNLYGRNGLDAYYRENGDCYDFVNDISFATKFKDLDECIEIMKHEEYYKKMYGASKMEIIHCMP